VYEEKNLDTSELDESIKDIDDTISTSSDTDIACNDTSVNSTSDTGKLENTTPPSKKITSQQILKKQESAKKNEERQRIKQVSCILNITSQTRNCIVHLRGLYTHMCCICLTNENIVKAVLCT